MYAYHKRIVFDMSSVFYESFLTKDCKISETYTKDCVFETSTKALKTIKQAEKLYPGTNFQLELVPSTIRGYDISKNQFWSEYAKNNNPSK